MIQRVSENAVGTQIGHQNVAIIGGSDCAMGVRSTLPHRIDARSMILHEAPCLTEAPIAPNEKRRDASAAKIRHDQYSPCSVER